MRDPVPLVPGARGNVMHIAARRSRRSTSSPIPPSSAPSASSSPPGLALPPGWPA